MAFSVYYLVWANEGDDVLRRFRAICSVEMLRVTWEKTRNPYVRLFTAHHRPSLTIVRSVTIPRPPSSSRASLPPVKGLLFFNGTEEQFAASQELVVDFPGGGFIAMGPDCHEERLRRWARRTNKPILGIDYGKAPECQLSSAYRGCLQADAQFHTPGQSKRASTPIGPCTRPGVVVSASSRPHCRLSSLATRQEATSAPLSCFASSNIIP